ncbi:MAG: MerR family transcriptional regulator [Flavobacteriales bacterium]|jgi:DNA-binding transcriptional MerR regulator|nr:MerR family transcriptional regulator [Flavobacteriales bacterium]MDG1439143.1 MerR family transcriptional regulator [Flavobacteriales bacterium]MDG1798233.1 MerR family transcriptional regulator [Flavobacteriales bacterium]
MKPLDFDIDKSTKIYYSIGEVSNMLNVNTSLIRFWEKEFDILKPKKNKKGNRQFTKEDVKNYFLIYYLVKERGYTLNGAKEVLKTSISEVKNQKEIVDKMTKIKSFLLNLKQQL